MNVFDYFFKISKNLDKDFVIGNKETISFTDLYNDSLKVASYLHENIGANKNVIVISKNSVFFISVYLGIIKSGNICVPVDFSIEQGNLNFISDMTESKIIFCDNRTKVKLSLKQFDEIIDKKRLQNIIKNQYFIDFDENYRSQNLAEIIFTSGSTGKPKGVMISHQNIISNTDSIVKYLELKSDDILLVVLPFYYCFGLSLLHTHLKVGASIVLNNTFMFLGTVINDLKNYRCSSFSGVPSHYQMLLKKSKSFKRTSFPHLKVVTQAGGKLHNIFIREFVESFPGINFIVMYGQTEATARLSYLPSNLVLKKNGSIGKAIPNVILKIIDKYGNEVDKEEVGEIVAKGGNIMQGYYKDLDGTKAVMEYGWLHTGDLAKMDNDGFVYIVAREKEIIKVGGKRISPKEIEEVILSVPLVVDCTISGFYDEILGEALKALVVIEQFNKKDKIKVDILKLCKKRLTLFKIPQIIDFKDKMAIKSTGKK